MLKYLDELRKRSRLGSIIDVVGYFYLSLWNHIFNKIPLYFVRYIIAKYMYGLKIGDSTIHIGVRFFSPWNITIGDGSNIQMNCFIDGRGEVVIGDNVDISIGVVIFTEQHDINSSVYATVKKAVYIHNHAVVGSFSLILPGVEIFEGAVVAAGSVVVKNAPEYSLVAGNPAIVKRDRSRQLDYQVKYKRPFH